MLNSTLREAIDLLRSKIREHIGDNIALDAKETNSELLANACKLHLRELAKAEEALAVVEDVFTYGAESLYKDQENENNGLLWAVVLTKAGPNKIHCIKVIRETTYLGLADAKAFCENAPRIVKRVHTTDEANAIIKKFAEVGATAEVRANSPKLVDVDAPSYGSGSIPKF